MITQQFDLNLIPDSAPVVVHVNQYDKGTGRLVISLYDGDTSYTPASGSGVVIQGSKPDGKGFDYTATYSGNRVTANLTEQMTAVAGLTRCQIVVTENNNVTGTFVFLLDVQKSALPADTDMSKSEYQIVMQLIEAAEAINAKPPYIGANGNWWVYSTPAGAYIDSGVDATITVRIADVTMLDPTATPYVTNSGTNTDPIFHLFIPRGKGISSVRKTATAGLVDTYTITYSDGATSTFNITNGNGIRYIYKTDTSGLVDTYTIVYDNGDHNAFQVTNGKTAYQSAVEGGYTGTEAEFEEDLAKFRFWAELAETKADEASDSADDAARSQRIAEALKNQAGTYARESRTYRDESEAWARGTRDGQDVPSTDETYQNNSMWYAQKASGSAASASSILDDVRDAGNDAVQAIENALDIDAPHFTVNLSDGHLYYSGGRFAFEVNRSNGHLEWGLAV